MTNEEAIIRDLSDRLVSAQKERDDALVWNNVLMDMLMRSEQKLDGVRAALADELISEHPGKVKFREEMRKKAEEDNNA